MIFERNKSGLINIEKKINFVMIETIFCLDNTNKLFYKFIFILLIF